MYTRNRWTEIMVASLDRHFPWPHGDEAPALLEPMRLRLRAFAQDVDQQLTALGNGREVLEWRATSLILRSLAKKTQKLSCNGTANCLKAFGPHVDSFVWAVYKNSAAVREAVEIWCHHLGWRYVYAVSVGEPEASSGVPCDGLCLIGLHPKFVLKSPSAVNKLSQVQRSQSSAVEVNAA